MFKKFIKNNLSEILSVIIGLLISGIILVFPFTQAHQSFAANFADDVLRPLIGNQTTITLESYFFNLQDALNQVKYHFIKPDIHVFENIQKNKSVSVNKDNSFSLTPIPVIPSLPESGEGVWVPMDTNTKTTVMARTFLLPDPKRNYAIVALVKLDMSKLHVNAVAGTWEPGEFAHRGPGKIPQSIKNSNNLIAAFNGGFQKKDGQYGMIVGNQIYLPLKNNIATVVIYSDKKPQIFRYEGQNFGSDVLAIRQNGLMLIENGNIVTSSSDWNMETWGLTTTNSMYTWRSGLGVTKNGNLIYAVGPSLIPQTLALSLKEAGAVNAMQLDINPVWVRFVQYSSLGNGRYTYQSLLKDMVNGGSAYLYGYQKDFFYVYMKS